MMSVGRAPVFVLFILSFDHVQTRKLFHTLMVDGLKSAKYTVRSVAISKSGRTRFRLVAPSVATESNTKKWHRGGRQVLQFYLASFFPKPSIFVTAQTLSRLRSCLEEMKMDPSTGALLPFEEVDSDAGAFAELSQMIRDPASVYNAVHSEYRFLLRLGTSVWISSRSQTGGTSVQLRMVS